MTIAAILVAIILAFLEFKLVKGVIKFGVLALIAVAVIYFLMKGGAF